jgi:hypothetical protein
MSLVTMGMLAGTTKQTLDFVPAMPDTCLIPAPPPPAGPQGIPTPFPVTCDTSSIAKKPVSRVKHKGGKVPNLDSIFKGVQGNDPGVGSLPPGKPNKDIITGVLDSKAFASTGSPTVNVGGEEFVFFGSQGMANSK